MLRVFIGHHHGRRTKLELGVPDTSARLSQPEFFDGSECLLVKLNRCLGVPNSQVREDFVNARLANFC
jgi:hypothetical protein